jgi:hypothetical protein
MSKRNDQAASSARHTSIQNEIVVAGGVFIALCVGVLIRSPQLIEPDDFAYRASIVALSQGHVLLTNAQYLALKIQLSAHGGGGIYQWVHLTSGKWISEKNPGYPFLAVVFQWLHALRWAPLFYGAFGCVGLFYGARRWLGPWGGTYTVILFCSSGAALNFAWRATIPTFSDASLIAGAVGLLLGVLLSAEDSPRRRLTLGVLAFVALDAAVFIRYTDVTVLIVALIAVLALVRTCSLSRAMLLSWIGVVVAFAIGDIELNHFLYGGYMTTGYPSGLITFGTSAIMPNLERMPSRLVESMPMVLLALATVVWIIALLASSHAGENHTASRASDRQDALVALLLSLGWASVWGLYATYTWTVGQTVGPNIPIHVVRFYVPALGLVALLAAWLLSRLPRWLPVIVLALLCGLGIWSYVTPSNHAVGGAPPSAVRSPVSRGAEPMALTRPLSATRSTLEEFA